MLNELEQRAGGVQPAIALLGVSQNRYYKYRSDKATMPRYIAYSIESNLKLPKKAFTELLERRVESYRSPAS